MVGHEDPKGMIVRAADGFLAVHTIDMIEGKTKTMPDAKEDIKQDAPIVNDPEWMNLNKKKLIDYAKVNGINLDRKKGLVDLRNDLAAALAAKA